MSVITEAEYVKALRHAGLCQRHLVALLVLSFAPTNRDGECMYCGSPGECKPDCEWQAAKAFMEAECTGYDRGWELYSK